MLKKMNSYKFKSSILLLFFFFILLAFAVLLFVNIQKDYRLDKRIVFYTKHAHQIQNFRSTLSRWFTIIYAYSADKNIKGKEKYIRLSLNLSNSFEYFNRLDKPSNIEKTFQEEEKFFQSIKGLGDELFSARNDDEIRLVIQKIKSVENKMMLNVDTLSNQIIGEASELFTERTKNYEVLLKYYIFAITFFFIFGFGGVIIFFVRNVGTPLKIFMKAIKAIEDGNLNTKIKLRANIEFERLAEAFNEMIKKVRMLNSNLQEKNDRLEAMVNTPAVGVVILDSDKNILYKNSWAQSKFKEGNQIGYFSGDIKRSENIKFKKVIEAAFETFVFEDEDDLGCQYECFMNKMGQETVIVLFDISEKIKLENNLQHYIQNIEEIVADKTKKLHKAYSDLEDKNEELKHLDNIKNQFLQNISHELRTPLTSIIGYLEVVLNYHNIPVTQRNFLQIALENGISLQHIINELLDLSEIESGHMKLNIESINIRNLVNNAVNQIRIQAESKKLKLSFDIDKKVDEALFSIKLDEKKITNVVNNLLSNAIKFTKKGKITVKLTATKKIVKIDVQDTGIGIKQEDMEIIFDKFRQVDSSISRAYEGAGLGLPMAKKILELHQSEIEVKSEVDKGSTFTILLKRSFD